MRYIPSRGLSLFIPKSVMSGYVRYNTCNLHASYSAVLGLTPNRRVILLLFSPFSEFIHKRTEILSDLPWTFTSYHTTTAFTSSNIFCTSTYYCNYECCQTPIVMHFNTKLQTLY